MRCESRTLGGYSGPCNNNNKYYSVFAERASQHLAVHAAWRVEMQGESSDMQGGYDGATLSRQPTAPEIISRELSASSYESEREYFSRTEQARA